MPIVQQISAGLLEVSHPEEERVDLGLLGVLGVDVDGRLPGGVLAAHVAQLAPVLVGVVVVPFGGRGQQGKQTEDEGSHLFDLGVLGKDTKWGMR